MQQEFRDRLPQSVQQLVDRLESFSGIPISVQPAEGHVLLPGTSHLETMGLECSASHATIIVINGAFSVHGVLHELLHLKRYWIDRVPQLARKPGFPEGHRDFADSVDNALEHLAIVPQEAAYRVADPSRWNEIAAASWATYPSWPTDPWDRRRNCLQYALGTHHLATDHAVKAHARTCLRAEGLEQTALRLADKIGKQMRTSKANALLTFLRAVRANEDEFMLTRIDVKARRLEAFPLG